MPNAIVTRLPAGVRAYTTRRSGLEATVGAEHRGAPVRRAVGDGGVGIGGGEGGEGGVDGKALVLLRAAWGYEGQLARRVPLQHLACAAVPALLL